VTRTEGHTTQTSLEAIMPNEMRLSQKDKCCTEYLSSQIQREVGGWLPRNRKSFSGTAFQFHKTGELRRLVAQYCKCT
jgi:hypothetical protein